MTEQEEIKTFKVNQFITLKLKDGKTNIYIDDVYIRQCKFLLIDIPIDDVEQLDELVSIDQASEKLDNSLEEGRESEHTIDPETEFWGHCSNIQVWAENNYNTKLLHRNIAFPILKRLTKAGDPIAKRIFKDEIGERFASGHESVMGFLLADKYLEILSKEEVNSLLMEMDFSRIDVSKFLENALRIILKSKHAEAILEKIKKETTKKRIYIPFDDFVLDKSYESGLEISKNENTLYYGTNKKELFGCSLFDKFSHRLARFDDNIDVIGISNDDSLLGLGLYKKDLVVWNLLEDEVVSFFSTEEKSVGRIKFSYNNKYLLASLMESDYFFGFIYIWDLETGLIHNKITSFEGYVPFDISPDGTKIIFATLIGTIAIMDIESKKIITKIPTKEDISDIYYTPNGKFIIAGKIFEKIMVWDIKREKLILNKDLKEVDINGRSLCCYGFTNPIDNNLIGILLGGSKKQQELMIYDFMEDKPLEIYNVIERGGSGEAWHNIASKGGNIVAIYILGGYVKVWINLDLFMDVYFKNK